MNETIIFYLLVALCIFILVTITRRGNIILMMILSKLGFIIYSGKFKKDYKFMKKMNDDVVGILSIPTITYSPILKGNYKGKDIKGYKHRSGELCIRGIENIEEYTNNGELPDMCIIEGSRSVNSSVITKAKLTLMTMYLKSDLKRRDPLLTLYLNGKEKKYRYLCAIDRGIESNERVVANSRNELVGYFKENRNDEKDNVLVKEEWNKLLILKAFDNIDVTMVLFEEVGD